METRPPRPRTLEEARDPAFWHQAAQQMKRAADAAWYGYQTLGRLRDHEAGPFFAPHGEDDPEIQHLEFEKLHAYLLAMAIQLMALSVLVHRDPAVLGSDPLSRAILELVADCGITPSEEQRGTLRSIESSLAWRHEQYSGFHVLDPDLGEALSHISALPGPVDPTEKSALDDLYTALEALLAHTQ